MAETRAQPHPLYMDRNNRPPRIGDRVRISGFLGTFEIVQIRQEGFDDRPEAHRVSGTGLH